MLFQTADSGRGGRTLDRVTPQFGNHVHFLDDVSGDDRSAIVLGCAPRDVDGVLRRVLNSSWTFWWTWWICGYKWELRPPGLKDHNIVSIVSILTKTTLPVVSYSRSWKNFLNKVKVISTYWIYIFSHEFCRLSVIHSHKVLMKICPYGMHRQLNSILWSSIHIPNHKNHWVFFSFFLF